MEYTSLSHCRALILGVANQNSLAWSMAKTFHQAGAQIILTYPNSKLERRVRGLAEEIKCDKVFPCDVQEEGACEKLMDQVGKHWDSLQVLVHSIAYANIDQISGPFLNVTKTGYQEALDVSAYSLVALTRAGMPLLKRSDKNPQGGSVITLTFAGSTRMVPGYHLMGVAKAALEAEVRYLAPELGEWGIRINAISAGPIKTLSSSVFPKFQDKLDQIEKISPLKTNVDGEDVAQMALFLAGAGSKKITGSLFFVDGGLHTLGG